MEFEEKYFENEVREGFFVPSMVKRAWAAELEVLSRIDRICTKYGIQYFAEWGTLLGAVRHNGFIPWDDDMDIAMKREDYERFLEVADSELPEGYCINNLRRRDDFRLFLARVMNTSHIDFGAEHLRNNHEFPYIAGVDIFVLDYVSADDEKENKRDTIADYMIALADCVTDRSGSADDIIEGLKKLRLADEGMPEYDEQLIRQWLGQEAELKKAKLSGSEAGAHHSGNAEKADIDEEDGYSTLHARIAQWNRRMYMRAEKLFASFGKEESKELTQLYPFGLRRKEHRYPKQYYENAVRIPFENTTIPVPCGYDAMLKRRYGDYMRIVRNGAAHDYPFFDSQQKQLDKLSGVCLPRYEYTAIEKEYSMGGHTGQNQGASLRSMAEQVLPELHDYHNPVQAQELAVDFGTLIEQNYGDDHGIVGLLESYCELLYEYACCVDDVNGMQSAGQTEDALEVVFEKIENAVQEHIIGKKEVVFIAAMASQWKYIKSEYEKAKNTDAEVYVVPVPYYHKRFDGSLYDMHCELDEFECILEPAPDNVHLTDYRNYNISIHAPECVYIQQPYDEWDAGISIHPDYYTHNIVGSCGKLVYVPAFEVDEISPEDECAWKNMEFYVTRPGVVRANQVIVPSENMRRMYIEKLMEWAGEDTGGLWENKITAGTQYRDENNVCCRNENRLRDNIPPEWRAKLIKADGSRRKLVLYHNEEALFNENGLRAFDKVESALKIFAENSEDILVVWNISRRLYDDIETGRCGSGTMNVRLENIVSIINHIGICDISDGAIAASAADAYYGDAGYVSRQCQLRRIPVMIEDVDIR